jgi:hypothetical protein
MKNMIRTALCIYIFSLTGIAFAVLPPEHQKEYAEKEAVRAKEARDRAEVWLIIRVLESTVTPTSQNPFAKNNVTLKAKILKVKRVGSRLYPKNSPTPKRSGRTGITTRNQSDLQAGTMIIITYSVDFLQKVGASGYALRPLREGTVAEAFLNKKRGDDSYRPGAGEYSFIIK